MVEDPCDSDQSSAHRPLLFLAGPGAFISHSSKAITAGLMLNWDKKQCTQPIISLVSLLSSVRFTQFNCITVSIKELTCCIMVSEEGGILLDAKIYIT